MGAGAGWQRNRWQRNNSADLSFPCHPFLCQKSPTTAKFAMVTAIAARKKLKHHSGIKPLPQRTANPEALSCILPPHNPLASLRRRAHKRRLVLLAAAPVADANNAQRTTFNERTVSQPPGDPHSSVERSALNVERSAPGAVFLSYASQDAKEATRICETLRAGGVEVWFDVDALVGGDSWDRNIRGQIGTCALFLPVISGNTQARQEGYFRLEWKLAEDRSHLMAKGKPFIVPVTVDATTERGAHVPDAFLAVQWTRFGSADSLNAFCERVQKLLAGPEAAGGPEAVGGASRPDILAESRHKAAPTANSPSRPWLAPAILGHAAIIVLALWRSWTTPSAPTKSAPSASSPAAQPPTDLASTAGSAKVDAKSVAVLPFANLSTEKDNEFFTDGVHDDVITNLQKIRDLKVISRTSVLAYRDAAARNLKKIADDLGVATVVEGNVRRVGKQVRVNAKLIVARTEESLWADSLTGDANDIFALQATIAEKIAAALKATLTSGERTLIARRPTQNQEAYDLYSRARLMEEAIGPAEGRESYESIIALHEQAVAKDPGFALAFAALSVVHGKMYWFGAIDPTPERRARAKRRWARRGGLPRTGRKRARRWARLPTSAITTGGLPSRNTPSRNRACRTTRNYNT
ncbi:MAG: TIR domain-containing protein [Opitutus sp.]|nr:TIR domain-containing protein [Opitutus sp.]